MFFDELEKKGLVKIYYRCNQFTICRLADWTIMAFLNNGKQYYDEDGDVSNTVYFGWKIDLEFARKIIANNAVFAATLLSKQTSRAEDLKLATADGAAVLEKIRQEIRQGTRKTEIDGALEKELKSVRLKDLEHWVQEYGNPPVFTRKKYWTIMLSFFLYPIGLPWFMAGNTKGGLFELGVMLLSTVLSVVFPPAIFIGMPVMVIHVFIFYFKLWTGKIKDNEGRPVITKAKQKKIAGYIHEYNAYKAELGV